MARPPLDLTLPFGPVLLLGHAGDCLLARAPAGAVHPDAGRAKAHRNTRLAKPVRRSGRKMPMELTLDLGDPFEQPVLTSPLTRRRARLLIAPNRLQPLSQLTLLDVFGAGPASRSSFGCDGVDMATDFAQLLDDEPRTLPSQSARHEVNDMIVEAARATGLARLTPSVVGSLRAAVRGQHDSGLLICRSGVFSVHVRRVELGHPSLSPEQSHWIATHSGGSWAYQVHIDAPRPDLDESARALSPLYFARAMADALKELLGRAGRSLQGAEAVATHGHARRRLLTRLATGPVTGRGHHNEYELQLDPTHPSGFRLSLHLPGFVLQGAGGEYFDFSRANTRLFLPVLRGYRYGATHSFRAWLHVVDGDPAPWIGFPNLSSDFDVHTRVGALCCGDLAQTSLREDNGPWVERPGGWAVLVLRKARESVLYGFRASKRRAVYRRPSTVYASQRANKPVDQRIRYSLLTEQEARRMEVEQHIPIVSFNGR